MKKITVTLAIFMLSACNGGVEPVDSQKFLETLDGPKVPTVQDTLIETAQAYEKRGDFAQASQMYMQALEHRPDDKNVMLLLADSYRRSGEIDKAIAGYDELIIKYPDLLGAKEGKGLALIAKDDFDSPVKLFDDVLAKDPTRWKTLNALGILFTTRNLHTEAQQYFSEALKQHADSPTILNNMGLSQALSGKYPAAIASLSKASALSAAGTLERKRVDLNLALVYAISGNLEEAHDVAQNYLSGSALNNNLGLYAHLAKDDQMARAYLNMALTESKVFYEKAWDNLQEISNTGPVSSHKPHKTKSKPKPPTIDKLMPAPPTEKMPPDLFPSNITLPSTVTPSE